MSKRAESHGLGTYGCCKSCNDYLVRGERGQGCHDVECELKDRTCIQCLVACECGAMLCEKHRHEVSGLILCRDCAKLELDADDLMEREAAAA